MSKVVMSAESIGSLAGKVSLAVASMSTIPRREQRVTHHSDDICTAIARICKRTERFEQWRRMMDDFCLVGVTGGSNPLANH